MSYAFVQSSLTSDVPLPFQINGKFSLSKATPRQLATIKEQLAMIRSFMPMADFPYEIDKTVVPHEKGTTFQRKQLPEEKWRYWVIVFEGANDDLQELEFALSLLKDPIDLGFHVAGNEFGGGLGDNPAFTFQFFNDPQRLYDLPLQIGADELREVGRIFDLIISAQHQKFFVYEAVRNFFYFKALASKSVQQVLCYFSVLESLLTHNPGEKEIGDSLTHQLRTKLALLEKMFARPLDFAVFKKEPKVKEAQWKHKIWTKLYSYRSDIAHGNRFNFKQDFPILGSPEAALSFLREVTKLVLILALEKPDFIEDLKAV